MWISPKQSQTRYSYKEDIKIYHWKNSSVFRIRSGFIADPDPGKDLAFYLSVNPDPDPEGAKPRWIHADPDPDPGQTMLLQKVGFWHEKYSLWK